MIIFGIRSKEKTKPAGAHHCPVCGRQREFAQLHQGRWFTLFFIPVIPLGSTNLHRLTCTTCGSQFNSEQIR